MRSMLRKKKAAICLVRGYFEYNIKTVHKLMFSLIPSYFDFNCFSSFS